MSMPVRLSDREAPGDLSKGNLQFMRAAYTSLQWKSVQEVGLRGSEKTSVSRLAGEGSMPPVHFSCL